MAIGRAEDRSSVEGCRSRVVKGTEGRSGAEGRRGDRGQ
jgi:hypothetical protein